MLSVFDAECLLSKMILTLGVIYESCLCLVSFKLSVFYAKCLLCWVPIKLSDIDVSVVYDECLVCSMTYFNPLRQVSLCWMSLFQVSWRNGKSIKMQKKSCEPSHPKPARLNSTIKLLRFDVHNILIKLVRFTLSNIFVNLCGYGLSKLVRLRLFKHFDPSLIFVCKTDS